MKAKKSLGQNWLRSESARAAMIEAAALNPADTVVEIGPGEGFLTEALLQTGAQVIAIEKDDRLIEFLAKKFAFEIAPEVGKPKLRLIHGDALEFEAKKLDLKSERYKVVANVPYYITGALVEKLLSLENQPEKLVLMLQKEVAERIVACDGKESILSISVKVFGKPKYLKTVPAGAFVPVPKVDSAILAVSEINRDRLKPEDEKRFFELLKRGFAHKRKLLKGNLGLSPENLETCGIAGSARAENVTIDQWLCLSQKF